MNDLEFKRHLRDLVRGHHHPEEHDWNGGKQEGLGQARSRVRPARPKNGPKKRRRSGH